MVDDRKQGGEELHHQPEKAKGPLAAREEEVLEFWNKERIFEKSLQKPSPKGEYVFYDGPPFANGLPHYGHILASTIKDAIPRYRTMQGYHVPRRWGWDCHGLPVENLVEKELGFKTKRDIEAYGIEKFNEAARKSIIKDVSDWKRIIPRLGRWADMEGDYKTMDSSYTESVWWAFKKLYDRGLIYEGFKAMHLCPRCGTTLSNFEVAEGYKDIDDVAVTVKLPLVEDPKTSLLIWTTTAWTLPGNAAAAVNADAPYVKVKTNGEFFIVAKERMAGVFDEAEIVEEMPGKALVGKKYLPPFDYFADDLHKHKTHAWKVYAAPFVTMDSGTGIVHIAPAFGADDLELSQKEKVPVIHHVTDEGKFIAAVHDFAGLLVKPKGNPRETDEKVAAFLDAKGLLFKQEKIKHSYPHCWRCDTPLLNWAANSWFVKVSALKSKLLRENSKVGWIPEHVGKGRFNNGLQSAPDWAISRSRYWGAPLPVWRNSKTKEIKVAGSINDLLSMVRRSGNRYFVMRHGEAEGNVLGVVDSYDKGKFALTDKGKNQVRHTAADLKKAQIDLIVTSPLQRTRETAHLVAHELGLSESSVMVDERLREVGVGEFDGGKLREWKEFFDDFAERFDTAPKDGESYRDARRRVGDFLFEVEKRYPNKNVLIVTHNGPAWLMHTVASRLSLAEAKVAIDDEGFLKTGDAKELPFTPFPHNADFELDLHRPYIDEVDTGHWKRIPDVFDCWFESGSMPYASNHYPFEKESFNPHRLFGWGSRGYPADFIAEGLDQTRGWFYSLIVLGAGLFGRSPYKNVIVNGLILASDGQKMSKRLRNYPDPMEVVEKYGADALRYYLLSSSVVRAEDLRFQEKGVDEVSKKLLMRLDNVRSFYELYADGTSRSEKSANKLDYWILQRLSEVVALSTAGFESYALDLAMRPMSDFIDDLSTWYVRRSRDRFKADTEDRQQAFATLRHVLYVFSHVLAPVMPFFAEDLYQKMKEEGDQESVHLSAWPSTAPSDTEVLKEMQNVRLAAAQGLQLREKEGIKVRQPLAKLSTTVVVTSEWGIKIVRDEVNVKEVVQATEASLDTNITEELKEEGTLREWIRSIQGWRKEQNLSMADRPGLLVRTPDADFIRAHREELMSATGLLSLEAKESETNEFERL